MSIASTMSSTDLAATCLPMNAEIIAETLPTLAYKFPADSNPDSAGFQSKDTSDAKAATWRDRAVFDQMLPAAVQEASRLSQALDANYTAALSAACDPCHTAYRTPIRLPLGDE